MKKIICILLCIVFALSFSACGKENENKKEKLGEYYIDDLTISYIEVYPELISGIGIAGMEVENFDANTLNYTVDVPENAFETLSESDIVVAFTEGFTEDNTTVTKNISSTGNTKLVNIER